MYLPSVHLMLMMTGAMALIAYDCGHENAAVTTLSIMDVGPCTVDLKNVTTTKEEVQLLQISQAHDIHVYQCKSEIIRTIAHCGMWSHASVMPGGISRYVDEVSRDDCMRMHKEGRYNFRGSFVDGIKPNSTYTFSQTIVGSLTDDATCHGATYHINGRTMKDVTVDVTVTLTLTDYTSVVRAETRDVVVRGGYTCPYNGYKCMDVEGGNTYWAIEADQLCEESKYDVLYTGVATRTESWEKNALTPVVMYSAKQGETVFTVIMTNTVDLCHVKGYATEHPSIFVAPTSTITKRFRIKSLSPKSLDMFTYMNNKFVHVEKHIRGQVENLYKDIMTHKCQLERELMATQLSIAGINPPEFASLIMKSPGFTASLAGEVIHVTRCQPVDVKIRQVNACFQELPVVYDNKTYFMTPRSHILQERGNQIPCSPILPSVYLINKEWYAIKNGATPAKTPSIMQPENRNTWTYQDPGQLAKAGIYTNENLEQLRRDIMYANERQAISNIMSRAASGSDFERQGVHVDQLLDESSVRNIMRVHLQSVWGYFVNIGMFFNGFAGIFFMYKTIKYLMDTTVHCHSLYGIFGLSWRLLGALWDVLTYRIIARQDRNVPTAPVEDNPQVVMVEPPTSPRPEQQPLYPHLNQPFVPKPNYMSD